MPTGSASPITPSSRPFVADPHDFDGSLRRPHATGDLRGLERRTGWCGCADEALGGAERDLAVRAHVDEEAKSLVARHPAREEAGDDVAAHVGAERREDVRSCARVQL